MNILIYYLDDIHQENVIVSLSNGTHTLGRGGLLDVKDKRVSRKHAVVKISEHVATLTSVHQNPCFFRAASGKKITILNSGQSHELFDGDQFSLLPDALWFQIKINQDVQIEENALNENYVPSSLEHNNLLKRQNDSESESANSKKSRLDKKSDNGDQTSKLSTSTTVSPDSNGDEICVQDVHRVNQKTELTAIPTTSVIDNIHNTSKQNSARASNDIKDNEITSLEIKHESLVLDNSQEKNSMSPLRYEDVPSISEYSSNQLVNHASIKQETTEELKIKEETTIETKKGTTGKQDISTPSRSSPWGRRDRCWYGPTCYRTNPNHRDLFSHPGDSDFDEDPNDDRPACPYGIACYRQNLVHRRQFKHPAKPAPKPSSPQLPFQQLNKKDLRKTKRQRSNESPTDDYDLDDPFLCDDSSDEYQCSEESDSDTDSQEFQED
ncbi:aprataxin and PNK-like factor isoform X2 [Cylas formicarius]|uniref:aprataxin and PNK-like factor isoform X2 n=1 Tax=Cylas formicarius TaxID=197179 RepID=UPI002958711E|nr:aprataxin and PNK-like factor isoform X2 [Cylas formicarius]